MQPSELHKAFCSWSTKAFKHRINGDISEALFCLRRAGEHVAELILRMKWTEERADRMLHEARSTDVIQAVQKADLAPPSIISGLHVLRTYGNKAVHEKVDQRDLNTAFASLEALIEYVHAKLLHTPVPAELALLSDETDPQKKLLREREALKAKADAKEAKLIEQLKKEQQDAQKVRDRLKQHQQDVGKRLEEFEKQLREMDDISQIPEPAKISEAPAAIPDQGSTNNRRALLIGVIISAVVLSAFLFLWPEKEQVKTQEKTATFISETNLVQVCILPFAVLQDDPNNSLDFRNALKRRIEQRGEQLAVPLSVVLFDSTFRNNKTLVEWAQQNEIDLLLEGEVYEPTTVDSGSISIHYLMHRIRDNEQAERGPLRFRTMADSSGQAVLAIAISLFERAVANHYYRKGRPNEALAILYASSPKDPNEVFWQTFFRADLHYGLQQYAKAIRETEKCLAMQPENGAIHAHMGKVLMANGDITMAKQFLKNAIGRLPKYTPALLDLSQLMLRTDSLNDLLAEQIEAMARTVVEIDSTSARGWRYLAEVENYRKHPDAVRTYAERSIALNPKDVGTRLMLAELLFKHYHEDEAAEALLSGILLEDSSIATALVMLANLYTESSIKKPKLGEELFKKSEALEPYTNIQTTVGLGTAAMANGEKEKALAYFEEAWAMGVRNPRICTRIAGLLYELKHLEASKEKLMECYGLDSMAHSINVSLGNMYHLSHPPVRDLIKAQFHFERALSTDPDDVDCLTGLGGVVLERGRPQFAERYLTKALSLDPMNYDANKYMSILLQQRGERKACIPLYKNMLRTKPNDLIAISNIGLLLSESGIEHFGEARLYIERALRIQPEDGYNHYALARILIGQKDYSSSAFHYQRAVALEPTLKDQNLEASLKAQGVFR